MDLTEAEGIKKRNQEYTEELLKKKKKHLMTQIRWCCQRVALNMPENLENSAVATGLEKVSFTPAAKKGNARECSNYCMIALISHAIKVMLKICQALLQQCVNWELSDVQDGFRKGRGTRD